MVNDKLYYDTGEESNVIHTCGTMDGYIESNVDFNILPTKNNESNFGIDILYQIIDDNNIDLRLDEGWIRFTKI